MSFFKTPGFFAHGKSQGDLEKLPSGHFSRREAKMRFPLRFIFSRLGD
jgi:hypothetical protein